MGRSDAADVGSVDEIELRRGFSGLKKVATTLDAGLSLP